MERVVDEGEEKVEVARRVVERGKVGDGVGEENRVEAMGWRWREGG